MHRRTAGTSRAAITIVLVALSITSCSTPPLDYAQPYATYAQTTAFGDGMQALLEGYLRQEDGCFIVEADDGAVVLPVFPDASTSWEPATGELTISGSDHRVDDAVAFGGGFTDVPGDTFQIPDFCPNDGEMFLVSSLG